MTNPIGYDDFKKGIKLFKEEETNPETQRKISLCVGRMMNKTPFWGYMITALHFIPTKEIEKYGIDYNYFYYNPDLFSTFNDQEIYEALYHSCAHLMLDHLGRGADALEIPWLMSSEISTTIALNELYSDIADSIVYTTENLHEFQNLQNNSDWVKQEFNNMSTEQVYEKLKSMFQDTEINLGASGNKANQRRYEQIQAKLKDSSCSMSQVMEQYKTQVPPTIQDIQQEKNRSQIDRVMDWVDTDDKTRGNIPGELKRRVQRVIEPEKIPWYSVLERFIQPIVSNDITWRKPSKSMLANGWILPGSLKSSMTVVVGLDTSGSIRDDEYNKFLNEIHSILNIVDNLTMIIVDCDARVQNVEIVEMGDAPFYNVGEKNRYGHGGTAFEPVFEWVQTNYDAGEIEKPDLLIYFTDMLGSFPRDQPDYETFWVSTSPEGKHIAPFGEMIYYNS